MKYFHAKNLLMGGLGLSVGLISILVFWRIGLDPVSVMNPVQSFIISPGDDELLVDLHLKNNTSSFCKLVAIERSCNCASLQKLPVTLAPNDLTTVQIRVDCSDVQLPAKRFFYLYTNPTSPGAVATVELLEKS